MDVMEASAEVTLLPAAAAEPPPGIDDDLIFEGDNPNDSCKVSYRELHQRVCQCANALKALGVQRGDRGQLLALGVTNLIALHAVLHMMVGVGLLPTTGLALPLGFGSTLAAGFEEPAAVALVAAAAEPSGLGLLEA